MLHELVDDRAGNLTRQTDNAANRAKHMTYDHANRVTRVTNPATGETVGRYHYDDQGFRVRKTALDDDGVDRKETMLLYASMYFGVEIQKDVYTGEEIYTVMNNIYLNGVRVAAMVPTGEAAHFHTDQVDSVKVVTNDAGAVVSRMEYLPYGETWFREGDDRFAPKYNSQELDKETGYYFYNARYYDPEICRFVTADNVIDGQFDTQGWNRFAYVKGNPILYKDPTGHETDEEIAAKNRQNAIEYAGNKNTEQVLKDFGLNQSANESGKADAKEGVEAKLQRSKDSSVQRAASDKKESPVVLQTHRGIELPIAQKDINKNYKDGVSSDYLDERRSPPHHGIDIPAKKGTSIHSTVEGKVVYAGEGETGSGYGNYGKTIAVQDKKTGLYVSSSHNSKNSVSVGDTVKKGQVVGEVGRTGKSDGYHVHMEVRTDYRDQNTHVSPYEKKVGQ
ncbi:MAG: peptidoglycan DD-metalloendopeptidase family protein [Spirochaetota bacterium]